MRADRVLTNGRIYTMEKDEPFVQAVAISGGRIMAMGDDDDMLDLKRGSGEWLDLEGRMVTPGLVDAHVHFKGYASSLQQLKLDDCRDLEEVLVLVRNEATKLDIGQWLVGRGWNQANWPGDHFPTAADLDMVARHIPVILMHNSGHAAWANSAAMRIAGIGAGNPDPDGGRILRDESGNPNGIFLETATRLVKDCVPRPSQEDLVNSLEFAQKISLKAGLTGIHDFDPISCFTALQTMQNRGKLNLRVVKNLPVEHLDAAISLGVRTGFGNDWLRIGGVKIFADGALGSRTAAMREPYNGEPENKGLIVTDKEEMVAYATKASAAGLSLTVHAIGDQANHDVLDVFAIVRAEEKSRSDDAGHLDEFHFELRHRIEHVQLLHPDDFGRLADLNVLASMQPIHATSDMMVADKVWGDRSIFAYAWRRVLNSGAKLLFGSDAPVEPIEPLTGLHAATTRRRPDGSPGPDGWYPDQRLTLSEALSAYTLGPALAVGQEQQMGTISPGKMADLTIFDRDLFEIAPDEILDVKVEGTVVGGKFAYRTW